MKSSYPWLSLQEIAKYEPEMVRLKVSQKARSKNGFLTAYKRIGPAIKRGVWAKRRAAFIARHMAQYRVSRGYRQYLALIAWAYMPRQKPKMPKPVVKHKTHRGKFGATDAVSVGFDVASGLWG